MMNPEATSTSIIVDMEKDEESQTSNDTSLKTAVKENADELDSFVERQAKRMARNPCLHLSVALILALALSVIAMVVGEFAVSANTGGWQSRGTDVADRTTQIYLTHFNQDYLFNGGDAAWDDLINNVQPGWEDDDGADDDSGSSRRRLEQQLEASSQVQNAVDYFKPKADRLELNNNRFLRQLPFEMTLDMHRQLEEGLEGCDMNFYTSGNLTSGSRLWPIWKTKSKSDTALSPDVIYEICKAEEATQAVLEENGLCFGCDQGCLPPYSIVLYARLTVTDGLAMSCEDLRDAWAPLQQETEDLWAQCVADVKETFMPNGDNSLPDSCPYGFGTSMVDEDFDSDLLLQYTSSIFATYDTNRAIDEMYKVVDKFDRAGGPVKGAYDTQNEDFVMLFTDASLNADMVLAMMSAAIIAIAVVLHTKSLFITLFGILQIAFSFPLAYFMYKLVLGLDFFPFLNFIGVFVIFALGADDIFVAIDKWKNARLKHPKASTEYVAALALPDAAGAMFLTTSTTAVAFFATAVCPVAPVKMFAIFLGLLVLFDYIMNILLVFPALCIYDKKLQTKPSWYISFSPCWKRNKDSQEAAETDSDAEEEEPEQQNLIQKILTGYYNILHRVRWVLLLAVAVGLGLSSYYTSTLELPTSSDVRLITEDFQYEQNYVWRQNILSDALERSSGSLAYVMWGVTPADTGTLNNPSTWSELVLDNAFDPSGADEQRFLLEFCDDLYAQEFAAKPDLNYTCSMNAFDEYLREQSSLSLDQQDDIYVEHCASALGVPVASENFDSCMIAWSKEANDQFVLSYQNKVTILYVAFASRVRFDDHYDDLREEWNKIEDYMKDTFEDAPTGVDGGVWSSMDFWWMDTNASMLFTAFSSAAIALAAASVVILLSSRSIVLTVFATGSVAYVLTSVVATLVGLGWTLGFLESICFAVLIGISVDFVVHFSHAYAHLGGNHDRSDRTKHALIQMGPSILAAALTTIISATIMLFTVITFFQKFALILFMTIIQATVGSFVVFLTLTDCIGPSNPTYLMDRCFGYLANLLGRSSEEVPAAQEKSIELQRETTDLTASTTRTTKNNGQWEPSVY